MPKINIPIGNGLYRAELPIVANIECNNCYVDNPQTEGALSTASLLGTAGISEILTTGGVTEVNRGSHVKDGFPYIVNGEALYRIDAEFLDGGIVNFSTIPLGSIPGDGMLSFADNGKQIIIVDPQSGKGWIVDEQATPIFQEITDVGFTANGQPKYVVFLDSFFIVTTDSKKFIKSDANNGLSWNPLDFGSAEKDPDDIVAPVTFRGELYISGSETIQSFVNNAAAAGASFPYQASGLVIPKGVFAPLSLIETDNGFVFIGGGVNESPAIWAVSGNDPIKISNTAIDSTLQRFSNEEIEQAFAFTYAQAGAYFIGFNFPTLTLFYDTVSQRWHQRTSTVTNAEGFSSVIRWRPNSIFKAYNRIFVTDSQDGRVGILDLDIYEEYGNNISRIFSTIPLSNESEALTMPEIEITMLQGVGSFNDDPKIRMSYSDNGGRTFSNELWRDIGKVGEYSQRAIWYRIGRTPKQRILRFEFSDKFKFGVAKLEARVQGGVRGR